MHHAYDCLYIALGETYGWDVVAADERLRANANRAGLSVKFLDLGAAGPR